MFKWIQLALEQWKTVMSILVLLGVSGVSIYGNVNEINPWRAAEQAVIEEIMSPEIKIIEKTIETRVVSGITKLQVDAAIDAYLASHIDEYH